MNAEQRFMAAFGTLAFHGEMKSVQIEALSKQVEDLTRERDELKAKLEKQADAP